VTLIPLVGSPDNPLCFDFHRQPIFDETANLHQSGARKVAREDFGPGLADQRFFGDIGEVNAQCDDVIDYAPASFGKLFDPPEGLSRLKISIASTDNAAAFTLPNGLPFRWTPCAGVRALAGSHTSDRTRWRRHPRLAVPARR
jgi:hypothetical protein